MSDKTLSRPEVSRFALWFGLLGGAGAWTAHLLLAYVISEFACVAEKDEAQWMGVMLPAWWLIAVSAGMLAIAGGATWFGWRSDLKLRGAHDANDRALAADCYIARTGLLMSGLFTFIILIESIPVFFYLQSC